MKIEINCTKNHDVYDIIDDYNSNSTYHKNEGNDDNDTIMIMITMTKR